MKKPRIGLLPFYIELYDKVCPDRRPAIESFYKTIAAELERRGCSVITAEICRVRSEFEKAIRSFESKQVNALVTLHLAYSPSLESAAALASTRLPIIVLDTTPSYAFGPGHDPDDIMYNHGIHGVQDMCNMLLRNGKPFRIEAGHWRKSDVLDRVAALARAAGIAAAMKNARVGVIGGPFKGMGDFAVPADALRRTIGITTVRCTSKEMRTRVAGISRAALNAELAAIRKAHTVGKSAEPALRASALAGLAVRRWIEEEELTAFTVNFLDAGKSGLPTMPFLEASSAMARGVGYAGEGDALTAALVGALLSAYPETTFTEMFCPDWKGGSVFLSHMGEMNARLISGRPLLCAPTFPFAAVETPVKQVGRLRAGRVVFVNLAPGPCAGSKPQEKPSYRLILAPGEIIAGKGPDRMKETVRGWFKPRMPLPDFLAGYSAAGGTHHAALVYGDHAGQAEAFGALMGWERVVLQ